MSNDIHISIQDQAELFQVLSNTSRILIIRALEKQEMSVGEIAECIGATLQNTSQHLRLMKDKGLVEYRREGQTVYYQVVDNQLGKKCKTILHTLSND
jgi:DNA-binding transcriptional ArsR family regulator